MGNVPWHQEVVNFVNALVALLPEYELASEHEHSNSLLMANKKVRVDEHALCYLITHLAT